MINFEVEVISKTSGNVLYTRSFGNVRFALNHSEELSSCDEFPNSIVRITATEKDQSIVIENMNIK